MHALSVAKPSEKNQHSPYIKEPILERNPINVQNVGKLLPKNQTLLYISERIQERKPMVKATPGNQSSLLIREKTTVPAMYTEGKFCQLAFYKYVLTSGLNMGK